MNTVNRVDAQRIFKLADLEIGRSALCSTPCVGVKVLIPPRPLKNDGVQLELAMSAPDNSHAPYPWCASLERDTCKDSYWLMLANLMEEVGVKLVKVEVEELYVHISLMEYL